MAVPSRFDGRYVPSTRFHRDVFEVGVERAYSRDSYIVYWSSRVCQFDEHIELQRYWVRGEESVYALARYIEQLVGRTVASLAESCRDPVGPARALMPHFQREIHRYMEEMERTGRERLRADTFIMPPIYMGMDYAAPAEDSKAVKKARELLMKNLNAEQLAEYKLHKQFTVRALDGKAYVISTARSFNVKGPDDTKYCGQLQDTPIEDQMLAQKLLLEHEPDKFFKNANKSGGPASQVLSRAMAEALRDSGPLFNIFDRG